ncbi:P-loop NTPase, partial [[Clostridium] innocuum]|uniref:P-loop NTPase n=1 Tax=Clostridium innocuum TaxID=1522 RepID=UPI001EDDD67F
HVTVTGVRGGVGASTVAVNLSWYLGVESKRHTVLLDTDLHRGVCAMMLGVKPGSDLRMALEVPQQIDDLLVERAT